MKRLLCTVLFFASCVTAFAQDARLAFREAVVVTGSEAPWFTFPDTTRMERAVLDDNSVYLGETLLPLGPGDMESLGLDIDPYTGKPVLSFVLGPEAAEAFAQITTERTGQAIALVLDGRVLTAPRVNGPITGGRGQIDGMETVVETEALARQISLVTGARPTENVLSDQRIAFRDSLDLSTPEAAARTLMQALDLRDLTTLVEILHPIAISGFVEEGRGIMFRGDSLVIGPDLAVDVPMERAVVSASTGDRLIAASDLLGRDLARGASGDVADVDIAVLVFALTGFDFFAVFEDFLTMEIGVAGAVQPTDSLAYVVFEAPFAHDEGYSLARALAFERVESEWRLLLPLLMMQR